MEYEERKIKDEVEEDKDITENEKAKINIHKYIGETSRSVYKRALEHQLCFQSLSTNTYLLKHWIDKHEGEDFEEKRFSIKKVKYTKHGSFQLTFLVSLVLPCCILYE